MTASLLARDITLGYGDTRIVSDLVAQLLEVPVGVVTVSVGGVYLAWLLAAQFARRA